LHAGTASPTIIYEIRINFAGTAETPHLVAIESRAGTHRPAAPVIAARTIRRLDRSVEQA
jgi:hypothetical protein